VILGVAGVVAGGFLVLLRAVGLVDTVLAGVGGLAIVVGLFFLTAFLSHLRHLSTAKVEEPLAGVAEAMESNPADLLKPSLRVTDGGFVVLSIDNEGPTLADTRLNVLAPFRARQREWVTRIGLDGAPQGLTSVISHELVAGVPRAVRWSDVHLEIHGYTTTEWKFFLPTVDKDPIHIRIGSDSIRGWREWVFVTLVEDDLAVFDNEEVPSSISSVTAHGIDEANQDYQIRQALYGARSTLRTHRRILSDRKLIPLEFRRDNRGKWESVQQKSFLIHDREHRHDEVYTAVEDAFDAVALIDPATVYNDVRLEALQKIERALELIEVSLGLTSTPGQGA
jgi:hypothetical protein